MLKELIDDFKELENPEKAKVLMRFFKTGRGEYGEGDKFLGITVPLQRKLAKKYTELDLTDVQKLLLSEVHEHRLTGLIILCNKYMIDVQSKKLIFKMYLRNTSNINNWDLVDVTAPNIAGDYLLDKDRSILKELAVSESLWERRIAIISTFRFIKENDFKDTLEISKILLQDKHDLIHKAVGWMLREVGKRDQDAEEKFLKKYYKQMPRTMLRYAIERFEESKRQSYLKGTA